MSALRPGSPDSRTFHTRAVSDDVTREFDYAVFVAGTRAYQIVAVTRADVYPALKDEL